MRSVCPIGGVPETEEAAVVGHGRGRRGEGRGKLSEGGSVSGVRVGQDQSPGAVSRKKGRKQRHGGGGALLLYSIQHGVEEVF